MIKYIILLLIGIAIIARYWYNYRIHSGTNKLAKGLKSGKLSPDSFDETFDILLSELSYKDWPNGFGGFTKIDKESALKFDERIKVSGTAISGNNKAVIIAAVRSKRDTAYSYEEMSILLPCIIFIVNNKEDHSLLYYSECLSDRNHEILLKNFIGQVHQGLA